MASTTLEEIKDMIIQLRDDFIKQLSTRQVSSKQIRTTSLSDISGVLGLIQSYEFRTPGDPADATYSGIQITPEGIFTYKNGAQTGGIQFDGDVNFGSDIILPGSTGFSIFSQSQTYNGETVGPGDILFGDNSTGEANLFWDSSSKSLQFRSGVIVLNEISNGNSLRSDGAKIRRTTNQTVGVGSIAVQFESEVYDDSGFADLVSNNTRLTIPVGRAGRYNIGFYVGFSVNVSLFATVQINGTGTSVAGTAITTAAIGSGSSEAYLADGDYLELIITSSTGATLVATDYRPSMWISRVR